MKRKQALYLFFSCIGICLLLVLFQPFSEKIVSDYQKKSLDATMLSHGETGKILKSLNVVVPIENKKETSQPMSNVLEVTERATKDRRKWIWLNKYKKYQNKGIFCYFEVESKGPQIPFTIYTKRGEKWGTELSFKIVNNRKIYSFFLDLTGPNIPLAFLIANKSAPFTVYSIAFLQNGYHPLIYSDRLSFSRILAGSKGDMYKLEPSSIIFNPQDKPKNLRVKLHFKENWMVGVSTFLKKQGSTHLKMIPRNLHPLIVGKNDGRENLAEMSKGRLPIISIDVQDDDLYSDNYGILKNFDEHGRDWERLSYVQYFREGEQIISSFTGLRLQGGNPGRKKGLINFRVFFREEYGKSSVEGSKIFDRPTGDIKRLAIKQSEWEKWPLNSPLAYDVSHEIGAWAPPSEPVILYLNGKNLGLYYIVPHLGERQLEEMLPKGEYHYYRWRGAQHFADVEFFKAEFWTRLKYFQKKITEKDADKSFDLENLINQIFSYIYNGTGDYCQGIAVKNTIEGSKMFWLSWDMDHSFLDFEIDLENESDPKRKRWQKTPHVTGFFALEPEGKHHFCPRVNLFKQLVNNDPSFKKQVKETFLEIMNHRVTDETISVLLYEAWNDLTKAGYLYRDEYISVLSDFFRHRKPFLIKQLEHVLPATPIKTCNVDADNFPVLIDGYAKTKRYKGYYLSGSVMKLEADVNSTFKHWLINGSVHNDYTVEVAVSSDQECQIKAVFH